MYVTPVAHCSYRICVYVNPPSLECVCVEVKVEEKYFLAYVYRPLNGNVSDFHKMIRGIMFLITLAVKLTKVSIFFFGGWNINLLIKIILSMNLRN